MKQLALLCLCAMIVLPAAAESPPDGLRVISWNIRHGRGMDGKIDLERIAGVLSKHRADLVLLQEVDRGCARSGAVDQAAEIGRLTGLHHAFGKAIDHDGGEYGLAILSRFPLGETKVHKLPGDGEARVVFAAAVETPIGTLTLASTHLDHQNVRRQLAQSQVAAAALLESPHPVILAGDLNARPDSHTVNVFSQAPWTLVTKEGPPATYPAPAPKSEIDYIILRGVRSKRPSVVIDEPLASDHRPVMATVIAAP
jgi:endonuclease/exonuclease/phosphatase family metal-dependent hydrolase